MFITNIVIYLYCWNIRVLWVLDVDNIEMPYIGEYIPTWLDRLAVAVHLKPIVLLPTIMAGIADLGLVIVDSVNQPDITTTALYQTLSQRSILTVYSEIKDPVYELEHGGDAASFLDYTLNFIAKKQTTTTTDINTSTAITTTTVQRQSFIGTTNNAHNQQDTTLRTALLTQNQDQHLHYFLPYTNSSAEGNVCATLKLMFQDDSLPNSPQQQLVHYVILPNSDLEPSRTTLQWESDVAQCKEGEELQVVEVTAGNIQGRYRVFTPQRVSLQSYTDYLHYCYSAVAVLPNNCPTSIILIAHRIRWLLILFHTSVQCKLSICMSNIPIAMDTLLQACTSVDTVLTRAYYNAPKDEFLNPKVRSRQPSTQPTHPTSLAPTRRPSRAHSFSADIPQQLTSTTEIDSSTLSASRNDVKYFESLTWSLDMLVIEVIDCLYAKLASTELQIDAIRAIYLCYFTTGSLNPSAEYLLKGKILLPHDFSSTAAIRFFEELRIFAEEDANFIELADTTLAEANSSSLIEFYKGIEYIQRPYKIEVLGNYTSILRAINRYDTIAQIQNTIQYLHQHLPHIIDLEVPDIKIRMKEHQNNIGRPQQYNGGNTTTTTTATTDIQHRPPLQAPPTRTEYSMRRRRAERIVVTFDTREYDPLWAFLLAETHSFNKTITSLGQSIHLLLTPTTSTTTASRIQCSILSYHLTKQGSVDSPNKQQILARVLQCLRDGFIPEHLLPPHSLAILQQQQQQSPLHIKDWCQELTLQRSQLNEWLSNGYPNQLRLHLLRNPTGLIHALKETFCMRTNTILEHVNCTYRIQDVTNAFPIDTESISKTNYGCSIVLTDLYLHNALFQGKSNILEVLPEYSASSFGMVSINISSSNTITTNYYYMYVHCILVIYTIYYYIFTML